MTPNGDPDRIAYLLATAEARARRDAAIDQAVREWAVDYYAPGWRATTGSACPDCYDRMSD